MIHLCRHPVAERNDLDLADGRRPGRARGVELPHRQPFAVFQRLLLERPLYIAILRDVEMGREPESLPVLEQADVVLLLAAQLPFERARFHVVWVGGERAVDPLHGLVDFFHLEEQPGGRRRYV